MPQLGNAWEPFRNPDRFRSGSLNSRRAGQEALQFVTIVHLLDADHDAPWVRWQVFDMTGTETSGVVCELNCLRSSLLDGLPGMAYRCLNEPDYTMIYISEGCRDLTGYAPEDLLNNQRLAYADLIVETDRARVWRDIQAAARTHTTYHLTYRIRTADGQEKRVWEQGRATANTYHGVPLLEGFITDVTAQAEIEIALTQRTEEVSLLYEASTRLSQSLDPDTLFETLHDIISRRLDCQGLIIADYDPETELITCAFGWGQNGRMDVSEFPPLALNKQGAGTQSIVIRSGEPLYLPDLAAQTRTSNTRFEVADSGQLTRLAAGEEMHVDAPRPALIFPLRREGQVVGTLQIFSDRLDAFSEADLRFVETLTPLYETVATNVALYQRAQQEIAERTAAEEAVRFQALLLDAISQAVIATDLEGRVTYWNNFATTLYGWSEQEALGTEIYRLTVDENGQLDAHAIMARLARGEGWAGEFVCRGKDGGPFPVFISDTPILR